MADLDKNDVNQNDFSADALRNIAQSDPQPSRPIIHYTYPPETLGPDLSNGCAAIRSAV